MKVLFVGIGSIAKRHIRNLKEVCKKRHIELSIDAFRRSSNKIGDINTVYTDFNLVPDDYDIIFITNPTDKHLGTLQMFHDNGRHFFIEKPVISIDQIKDAMIFELRNDSVYYVACPLRFNSVIQYVKHNINPCNVISVRSISSSYLPSWRPNQDYRNLYSAHKDMGGGVSIDLIHEWDYLTYLFGWPNSIFSAMGKKSSLEIDSDDYALYIAEYKDKIVELHLDYFGRKTIREVQLFTKDDTVICDIENNRIKFLVGGQDLFYNEKRDDYQKKELEYFIDVIYKKNENNSDFKNGIKVLELTQGRI